MILLWDGRSMRWHRECKAVFHWIKGERQRESNGVAIQTGIAERCTAKGANLRHEFVCPIDHWLTSTVSGVRCISPSCHPKKRTGRTRMMARCVYAAHI